MGYQVQLLGYTPGDRRDGNPWTSAWIYEAPTAATAAASRTQIDTKSLSPLDADPTAPATRDFETFQGTVPHGAWYWVEFHDAAGNAQLFGPSFNMADGFMPTAEQIRSEERQMPWADWGYDAPEDDDPDRLDVVLFEAESEMYGYLGALVAGDPDERAPLVRRAMKMLVIYNVGSSQAEVAESAFDYDMVSAMSAEGYSETRRGVTRPNPQVLHPWPALNRLLDFILHYGRDARAEDGPGVCSPGAFPPPYEEQQMQRAYGRRYGRGGYVTGGLWSPRFPGEP